MRKIKLVISFFLLITIAKAQPSPAVLTGTIKASGSPDIYINLPVAGGFYDGAVQKFGMDTLSGNYTINLPIQNPGFIIIHNNWYSVKMYIEPGQMYEWNTVFSKTGNTNEFKGHYSEANTLLNTLSSTPDSKMVDIGLFNVNGFDAKKALWNKVVNEKLAPITDLYNAGKVNKEFYDAFKNEIRVWSLDVLSTYYFFAFRDTKDGADKQLAAEFINTYMADWEKIYAHINDSTQWLKATASPSLLGRYTGFREIKETNALSFNDNYFEKEWEYYKNGLNGKAREYAMANVLYRLYSQNEFDKKILKAHDELMSMYPQSPLKPYLQGPVQEVIAYHENIKKKDADIKFMKLPATVTTPTQLYALLKNNKITYIDMWATWCMPCRMELKYAVPLHDEFEKIGVNLVYLSIDAPSSKIKWESMVKSMGLKGTNILANPKLQENLKKSLKRFAGIPRYIILSPDGKILDQDAKRPTDNLDLLRQLKSFADKYNKVKSKS